ncbi:MAG: pyruvate carboxylase [Lautropia sp. SCN 69-89]|mgnify:FL=1|nr:MAG: pyruvate carboxylase [Lautropia sp. SCN 69-89]
MPRIQSVLVANRSEIAIRVMRAAAELGMRTVAIYSHEDRFALHRFKADESYLVGEGRKPLQAYLDIDDIIRIARRAKVDAIHPGYGFLSENPDFARACAAAGIVFVGPTPEVMTTLGNKIAARAAAVAAGVPVMPATGPLPADLTEVRRLAAAVGYPLMLKASWGGGGRGMRVIESEGDLEVQLPAARREAAAAFGNDEVYLEKLVRNARHVEVQVVGDRHGNLVHLFERDCSVQRRNQKVVERAPAPYLDDARRAELCEAALRLARQVGYTHAGTIEFLMDADSGRFYFIEVNPRIQVEHTVTEQVTGIDIVKAQLRISEGARIGDPDCPVPRQEEIRLNGHALQCRITTEDPENNFTPDYGRITAYRSAAGFGLRLDGGTAYSGAVITPYYDSLLVKVTAWAPTAEEAIRRMDRGLREFRIRGLATNLQFVENVINHPDFVAGRVTTRFIDTTPELFRFAKRRDRATRLLRYIGDVTVNGHPDMKGRARPELSHQPLALPRRRRNGEGGAAGQARPADAAEAAARASAAAPVDLSEAPPAGTRQRLREIGPQRFAEWMRAQPGVLLTDTTMRDAHQSLFATRMRTIDMLRIAPYYARMLPQLLSLECWGGATFDVALRFLKEDPWERLARLREAVPNILLQMLLRGSNAVGYTNYSDNVVRYFVARAAAGGIDLFRVFDSLNWVENMRVAIDAVLESGALCEGAICYTADLFDASRPKYGLRYYLDTARQLQRAGVHVIGVKDMAGVCRPRAARELVRALREETGLPVHFHTHDTSGAAAASVLAAIDGGADAVDGAIDAMSGLTSQPNLGAIVAALEGGERDTGVDRAAMQEISHYWESVRRLYAPFESDIRAGTADVYRHEMPGGQYTNLREQARALGLEQRWPAVAQAYAEVNRLFGDIVKVTPTSKVVGDMALFMVANDLSADDVLDPARAIAFPESVVSLFRGELGFPPDGFPQALSRKVLDCDGAHPLLPEPPAPYRPGDRLAPVDLEQARQEACKAAGHRIGDDDLASWLMYPKVFRDYAEHRRQYGDVSLLPTQAFFYGMREREEIVIDIDPGKKLIVGMQGMAPAEEEGLVRVFFELNGQPRTMRIEKAGAARAHKRVQAESGNPAHVAAPMPGMVVTVAVKAGQAVRAGDPLVSIEAMKMETQIRAERDGTVRAVHVRPGETVSAHDLLLEY